MDLAYDQVTALALPPLPAREALARATSRGQSRRVPCQLLLIAAAAAAGVAMHCARSGGLPIVMHLAAATPGALSAEGQGSLLHPPQPGQYLIVGEVSYGRYSNNRAALVDAIALAGLTRRVLLLPSPRTCASHRERLADVWDLAAIERLAGVRVGELAREGPLRRACAG
jgi:hypothetical protein